MTMDKVTVVTVVYNAYDLIEGTLKSVLGQSYSNIEYIVVDGGSSDGTMDVVNHYKDSISIIISEPDLGLYDAMNKGIALATGKWINFMNAGDTFFKSNVISDLMRRVPSKTYFIYGDYLRKHPKEVIHERAKSLEDMWKGISFSHQSLFSNVELMKQRPFKLSYSIVCDYESYFYFYMQGRRFWYSNSVVAVVLPGGVSEVSFFLRTYERWKIVKRYKPLCQVNMYYASVVAQSFLTNIKIFLKSLFKCR